MRPTTWGWLAALLAWAIIVCFFDLQGGAGFEPVDCWVAQTAREMYENVQETGWRGLIIPEFCGEVRMQKSPGPYWAVMLTAWLRGGEIDEVSARIPNSIGTVILVLTIFWLTRRIAGDRAAVIAGFAALSSAALLYWSHRAASDLGVTTLMTLSLACLWIGSERTPPGAKRVLLWLAGYFCAGLAMLYKMPMPLVCVGLPAVLYVVVRKRWRIFASWWHLVGLVLFALPWLPWVVLVLMQEPTAWDKWRVEFLDRATGELPNVAGQDAWYYSFFYIGVAFAFTLPWCVSIPGAIVRAFHRDDHVERNGQWFLLLWLGGLLLFFSIATGKETRYFLPALPPLLCLLGIELAAFFDPQRRATPALDRVLFWLVLLAAPLGAAAAMYLIHDEWFSKNITPGMFTWGELWPPLSAAVAIFVSSAVLTVWLRMRRREHASFAALAGGMVLTWLWAWPMLVPLLNSQATFRDFGEQLRTRLTVEQRDRLRQIAQQDPRVIWYSDVRFPRIIDQLDLLAMQDGQRDLEWETRKVGEQMIAQLEGDELALLVISPLDYLKFMALAPQELAEAGRRMPQSYVWLQASVGRWDRRYLVFANQPPPWTEPEVLLPDKPRALLARARDEAERILRADAPVEADE